ncbi:pullulanase, partial [Gardnerella leopoldii]|nr:pullulanase [Gardnerella leopoldii]
PLVDWYSALIKLRAKNADFYDAQHTRLTASDNSILAEQIGSDLIVCANPMKDASATVDLPAKSARPWRCVLDSSEYFDKWTGHDS